MTSDVNTSPPPTGCLPVRYVLRGGGRRAEIRPARKDGCRLLSLATGLLTMCAAALAPRNVEGQIPLGIDTQELGFWESSAWKDRLESAQFAPTVDFAKFQDISAARWSVESFRTHAELVADGHDQGFDVAEISATGAVVGRGWFRESGFVLSIAPTFTFTSVTDASDQSLPEKLYRAGTIIQWMLPLGARVDVHGGVFPNFAADAGASPSDLRFSAHAMLAYRWQSSVEYVYGVAYLDRHDAPLLPLAGAIWTPSEDVRFELTAPRPRIARRLMVTEHEHGKTEEWGYVGGEFGGGAWTVERRPGLADEFALRDFRVVVGYESKSTHRVNAGVEIAYVFGRKAAFESDGASVEPDDALMLRSALFF